MPQPLFDVRLARSPANSLFEYDVTADGKRFLLDSVSGDTGAAPLLTGVVNWDAALKK